MESRFQANIYSDMTLYSSAPINSLTHQALQGPIQRELEKRKIREEILAAEIAHRSELEAEVRRELWMERELSLQRQHEVYPLIAPSSSMTNYAYSTSGVNEKLSSYAHAQYETPNQLPFQPRSEAPAPVPETKTIPVKTGQLLFIPKSMNANLSGKRREAQAQGIGATRASSQVDVKKKTPEWSCALCKVSATSQQGLEDHMQGKKHKRAASKLVAEKRRKQTHKLKMNMKKRGMKNLKFHA